MDISLKLVSYIREQKISTTEIADSLAKTGEIPLLFPIKKNDYAVGIAHCMFTAYGSNFYLHEQVRNIKKGEIALIFSKQCSGQAIFGDIVAKYILEVKGALAIVTQGAMRDLDELRERNYPIWCESFTPIGCVNKPTSPYPYEQREALMHKYKGSILVCDSCGVVAIPRKYHNESMMQRIAALRLQEEVWNYCIDELGWDSVKTICEKEYLANPAVLPSRYQEQIELLKTDFSIEPLANQEDVENHTAS